MMDRLAEWLFDPSGLTAHGFCLLWEPSLIWVHALADSATGLAYFTIPLALAIFTRRRPDLALKPVLWLFVAFILLCGAGHWLDLATLWVPIYGIEGVVKAATAIVSVFTAVALWLLLPDALALPSPAQLRDANVALRESEARARASFERSPVPLHTIDQKGRITGVSDSWVELFGYPRAEVIGHHLGLLEVPGAPSWVEADRERLLECGEIRDVERRLRRKDGQVVEAQVSARVEGSGEGMGIVCVLIDITARRRAEEALRATEERLHQSQKMEAIGQLTGGVAHDFNNMLQGIGGCLDLMERRLVQGRAAEIGRYMPPARQAVDRASRLTSRMLAFARRQTLQPRPVDPDTLVRGMEELIRQTVGPSVEVALDLHDGAWSILCDSNQLESALLNLAINARDAMPEGGRLTMSTTEITVLPDEAAGQDEPRPGQYIAISVADTGTGMPASVMARMFDPFFTTKPIGEGSGLGLSQLYGFVRQSGGFVRAESVEGEGTVMHIHFPRHDVAASGGDVRREAAGTALAGGAAHRLAGATVLLVEDEDTLRGIIGEALHDLGCVVLEASDGPAGLKIVQSDARLDLLITDVGLPGLNGRQLAEAARGRRPGLPILIITGYAGTALQDMELSAGMMLLRKPFPLKEFNPRVVAMLDAAMGAS